LKFVKIDPDEADRLRSGLHTREEIREQLQERTMIQEEEEKDKAKHHEKTIRELEKSNDNLNEEEEKLLEMRKNQDKPLSKEEKERIERESF